MCQIHRHPLDSALRNCHYLNIYETENQQFLVAQLHVEFWIDTKHV